MIFPVEQRWWGYNRLAWRVIASFFSFSFFGGEGGGTVSNII